MLWGGDYLSMKNKSVIEIAGWFGVALILVAYLLNSFEVVASDSSTYQTLNALGAAGIVWSSTVKKDYQPALLNLIWLIIALIALVR